MHEIICCKLVQSIVPRRITLENSGRQPTVTKYNNEHLKNIT